MRLLRAVLYWTHQTRLGRLFQRVVFIIESPERRQGRERRRLPWDCRTCHTSQYMRIVGGGLGVDAARIVKCGRCGHMDRRLPTPRRDEPWEPYPSIVHGVAWGRLATLALIALGAGLVVARW